MKYKIGINLDLGFNSDLTESLIIAKKAGFNAFFVLWKSSEDTKKICELNEIAKKEGMIFQSIHVYWDKVDKIWSENEFVDYVVNYHNECIELCAKLNVPLMVIHPFVGFGVEYKATDIGIENFKKIVQTAEKNKVKLAFENVEGEPYLNAIIEQLGNSPFVGFCWDTGHEQCYNRGKQMPELYANGKLFSTHFNDNLGVTGNEITWLDDAHLLPYDGKINWHNIMERLKNVGFYEDVLTFELTKLNKPDRHTHDIYKDMTEQEFLNEAYKRAKRVCSEI